MINSDLANFLIVLYMMYGCFMAGKVNIGIKLDRAQKGEPVSQFALSLVAIVTIFLWAPIMLLGGKSKKGGD